MKQKDKKRVTTIYDIAKSLGISASTVSRALNNHPNIAEETKTIILEAAKSLNYMPNPAARYLKTQRTNQIMLSIPHLADEFYLDMISAVQTVAKSCDYSLILNYTEDSEKEELRVLKNVRNNFVDGLILISLNFTERHIKEIENLNHPIVLSSICTNKIKGGEGLFDYVGVDTKKGIYLAAKHLIGQGHTKIGFIGHSLNTQTGDERYKGFCLAMNESGLEIKEEYIITGEYTTNFGYEAGLAYAEMEEPPTAICAAADLIVLGLYRAFERENIRIPDDICIIGMDNINTTTLVKPKISTVAISQGEIGRYAAEQIFRRLEGSAEPSQNVIFEPRLVIRESSINVSKR